jgi:hypothetical protein
MMDNEKRRMGGDSSNVMAQAVHQYGGHVFTHYNIFSCSRMEKRTENMDDGLFLASMTNKSLPRLRWGE